MVISPKRISLHLSAGRCLFVSRSGSLAASSGLLVNFGNLVACLVDSLACNQTQWNDDAALSPSDGHSTYLTLRLDSVELTTLSLIAAIAVCFRVITFMLRIIVCMSKDAWIWTRRAKASAAHAKMKGGSNQEQVCFAACLFVLLGFECLLFTQFFDDANGACC